MSNDEKKVDDTPEKKSKKQRTGSIMNAIPDAKAVQSSGITKSLGTIKTRKLVMKAKKPNQKTWFWIYDNPEYMGDYRLVELESDQQLDSKLYLIDPSLHNHPKVIQDSTSVQIYTYCTTRYKLGLFPLNMYDSDWRDTAMEGIEYAKEQVCRLVPNIQDRCYDIEEAEHEPEMVDWEQILEGRSFTDLLNMAFKNRYVTDYEHPLFQEIWLTGKG